MCLSSFGWSATERDSRQAENRKSVFRTRHSYIFYKFFFNQFTFSLEIVLHLYFSWEDGMIDWFNFVFTCVVLNMLSKIQNFSKMSLILDWFGGLFFFFLLNCNKQFVWLNIGFAYQMLNRFLNFAYIISVVFIGSSRT